MSERNSNRISYGDRTTDNGKNFTGSTRLPDLANFLVSLPVTDISWHDKILAGTDETLSGCRWTGNGSGRCSTFDRNNQSEILTHVGDGHSYRLYTSDIINEISRCGRDRSAAAAAAAAAVAENIHFV